MNNLYLESNLSFCVKFFLYIMIIDNKIVWLNILLINFLKKKL